MQNVPNVLPKIYFSEGLMYLEKLIDPKNCNEYPHFLMKIYFVKYVL